jgi:integrase
MEVHKFEETDQKWQVPGKPKNFGKKQKIVLSKEQREELLKKAYSINYKHGLIIELGLNTGLRVNELANLIIENFNSYTNSIFIRTRTGTKYYAAFKTKTEKSNRELQIPKNLSKKIEAHIGSRKTGYIFRSQRSSCYSKRSLINMINKYANQCKTIPLWQTELGKWTKNIGFHCLRATFCSFLVSKNLDLLGIQNLMGHQYTETTFKYIKQIAPVNFKEVQKLLKNMNDGVSK